MAITKIKRIELIGLQEDRDRILALLQKLAVVELIDIREPDGKTGPWQQASEEMYLPEIEEAISYMGSFEEEKGFLEGIVKFKPLVHQEQLKDIIENFDYAGFLKQLSQERNNLKNMLQNKEGLFQERCLLLPWRKLGIPLDQIRPTKNCGILLGTLSKLDYEDLLKDCENENMGLFCDIVNQDKTNLYLAIIYIKDAFERIEALLKNYNFNFITLTHHGSAAKDRLLEINFENLIFDDQIEDIKQKIRDISKGRFKLMAVYDYLANIRIRQESAKNLARQRFTFMLNGWIRAKDIKVLEKAFADKFDGVEFFISEPKPGEEAPVGLENNRLIQPFEFITNIYGPPKYNEIDPTPFLAPFFFLYFGFCVSDVGYGFTIILVCWLALKKLRLGGQGVRFFRLFLLCGISTVIIGAITGGWFGNLVDIVSQSNSVFMPIKRFKDSLILLDPLKEPTKLLGIALSLGIIQVWFGNVVAAIGNIKNKRYLDILLDQVTMLTLLFGLTGLGLIFLRLIGKSNMALFKYSALFGALGILITQGRSEKALGSKLFYGAFTLYNSLSGYLSDILSYSRLWALGLVTGVMANTVNLISMQFAQITVSTLPFINRVGFLKFLISSTVLITIFILGHTVSFFMNLLGAFVHPVRLQFVEFFSKFFKSGGSFFKPFKVESKYINME